MNRPKGTDSIAQGKRSATLGILVRHLANPNGVDLRAGQLGWISKTGHEFDKPRWGFGHDGCPAQGKRSATLGILVRHLANPNGVDLRACELGWISKTGQ